MPLPTVALRGGRGGFASREHLRDALDYSSCGTVRRFALPGCRPSNR